MTHHTLTEIEARFADLGDGRISARVHLGASDSADCPGNAGQASTGWVLVGPGVITFYRDQAHEIVSHGTAWLTRTSQRPGLSEPEGPPHERQATDLSQTAVVDGTAQPGLPAADTALLQGQ
ncbi:hypothetical protein ACIGO9_30015 [Nocardia asteroides]|uniref:hypothetical protein n=1 Tax=Nocardia asteroides TaxID=1824 RepID=UPI0037C59CCF